MSEQPLGQQEQIRYPDGIVGWEQLGENGVHPALEGLLKGRLDNLPPAEVSVPIIQGTIGELGRISDAVSTFGGTSEDFSDAVKYISERNPNTPIAVVSGVVQGEGGDIIQSMAYGDNKNILVQEVALLAENGATETAETAAYLIDNTDQRRAERQQVNAEYLGSRATRQLQEQVFGAEVDIAYLVQDTAERLAIPAGLRQGQEIHDSVGGRERRPIMDISLGEQEAAEVQVMIEKRSENLQIAKTELEALFSSPNVTNDPTILHRCKKILEDKDLLGAKGQGNLLSRSDGAHGSTIADLYIDDIDLGAYKTIDQIVAQNTGVELNSTKHIAESIVNLAGNTFPSGVEFAHGVMSKEAAGNIKATGKLATRSQTPHGFEIGRELSANGAFLHMARPGTFSAAYARENVVLVGTDEVFKKTPYMHLEDDYVGNRHQSVDGGQAAMQFRMGSLQINTMEGAPEVFRAALHNLHTTLQDGIIASDVDLGAVNNYSFAASSDRQTAGAYIYDVQGVHMAWADRPIDATTMGQLIPLEVSNFSVEGPITVYAPTMAREVDFTESMAGNEYGRDVAVSLDSIKPEHAGKYLQELVENGIPPEDALRAGIAAVVDHDGDMIDVVRSYQANADIFEQSGISPITFMDMLPKKQLSELDVINVARLTQHLDVSKANEIMKTYIQEVGGGDPHALGALIYRAQQFARYAPDEGEQQLVFGYHKLLADKEAESSAKPMQVPMGPVF